MRQLQLFTKAELAGMRDRTASRSYSPGREQFRREHERHRAWGLARRHAERLRHARNNPRNPRATSTPALSRTPAQPAQPQPDLLDTRPPEPADTNPTRLATAAEPSARNEQTRPCRPDQDGVPHRDHARALSPPLRSPRRTNRPAVQRPGPEYLDQGRPRRSGRTCRQLFRRGPRSHFQIHRGIPLVGRRLRTASTTPAVP